MAMARAREIAMLLLLLLLLLLFLLRASAGSVHGIVSAPDNKKLLKSTLHSAGDDQRR
jgi:hypothetical protein